MEPMYRCVGCDHWIGLTGSTCVCDPKQEYEPEKLNIRRTADIQLSGNGQGLNSRRPIPDTQG